MAPELVARTFAAAEAFHALPEPTKAALAMDATPRTPGEVRARDSHSCPRPALPLHSHPLFPPRRVRFALQVRAGCGYLHEGNTKLPARPSKNYNSAFVVKREAGPRDVTLERMPWPDEAEQPSVRGVRQPAIEIGPCRPALSLITSRVRSLV